LPQTKKAFDLKIRIEDSVVASPHFVVLELSDL
jgi:hypothetical protein